MAVLDFMNSWFDSRLLSKTEEDFRRLKTQSITLGQQIVVDGFAFTTHWVELSIPAGASRYVAFDVPSGYTMILDYRLLYPSGIKAWYHVYNGNYVLGAQKSSNEASGFIKTRNMRDISGFSGSFGKRYNVSTEPTRITDSIIDEPVWGSSTVGERTNGSLLPDSSYLSLSGGQQFLLQMYNGDSSAVDFSAHLNYAMLPNSKVSPTEV